MKVTILASKTRQDDSDVFKMTIFYKTLKIATFEEIICDDDVDTPVYTPKMTIDTWKWYREELEERVIPDIIFMICDHAPSNSFTGVFYDELKDHYDYGIINV